MENIVRCALFAAEFHKHQTRKSDGGSYITHPLGVAWNIINVGQCNTPEVVMAGILHDTVEDTDCTLEDIKKEFGHVIANIVDEVSDDKSKDKISRKKHQVTHCTEISKGAHIVKLADKLHNLTDMCRMPPKGWSVERVQGYFEWALTIVDMIKHANVHLADAIYSVASGTFNHEDGEFPCYSKEMTLEKYYGLLESSNEK